MPMYLDTLRKSFPKGPWDHVIEGLRCRQPERKLTQLISCGVGIFSVLVSLAPTWNPARPELSLGQGYYCIHFQVCVYVCRTRQAYLSLKSYSHTFNQKTSFTKFFKILQKSPKLVLKTGNGIISSISWFLIPKLLLQNVSKFYQSV